MASEQPDTVSTYRENTRKKGAKKEPDAIALYLRQISFYPLLSEAEEQGLAETIQTLRRTCVDLRQRIKRARSKKQEYIQELESAEAGLRESKNRMINANLRLVVSIAKKYQHRGLNLLDLIDEGNIGLIEAVERFDYTKGCRFSTYGTWWIRQAIIKSLADKGRIIRIPVHMLNTIKRCFYVARQLTQEYGRDPSSRELSRYLDMPEAKVQQVLKLSQEATSLDTTVDEEDNTRLADLIHDKRASEPFDLVFHMTLQETIQEVLSELTEREMKIIQLRYGLNGEGPYTLQETGRLLGITRERVRQIQEKAITKLRGNKAIGDLREIL
jgi:RNA polymerase primary sigma factor